MTTPSFRFNALQEELIELPPDDPEPQDEKQASSTPSDTGARDGSPFRRFGKRSTSVDTASTGDGMVADHPWSFLHGECGLVAFNCLRTKLFPSQVFFVIHLQLHTEKLF